LNAMRTLITKSLIAAVVLLIAMGVFSGTAWAKIVVVSLTGNDASCQADATKPCKTLQGALTPGAGTTPAAAGDTIQILPGTYNETTTDTITAAMANLTIIGAGHDVTIINGSGVAAGHAVLLIDANGVTLQGFTITGAIAGAYAFCSSPANVSFNPAIQVGAVAISTNGVVIRSVEVTGNAVGITVCNSSNTQVTGNNIHDNTVAAAPSGAGVAILKSNHVTVQNNTFSNTPGAATDGVLLAGDAGTKSISNTISNNTFSGFAGTAAGIGVALEIGIYAGAATTPNNISNNTFTIPAGNAANLSIGINISDLNANTNTISGNTFDGGGSTNTDGIIFNAAATNTTIGGTAPFSGNVFRRLLVGTIGGSGIEFHDGGVAAMNTVVTQNAFINNTNGINFNHARTAGENNQFISNQITGNQVGVLVSLDPAAAANEIFAVNNIAGNIVAGWRFTAAPTANAFPAYANWWGNSNGPNCATADPNPACDAPQNTTGDVVTSTAAIAAANRLTVHPASTVPFGFSAGAVSSASLERAPAPLSVSSIQAMGPGGFRPGLQVRVQGQGIAGVQLQVYDLSGRVVADQSASGASLRWNGLSSLGRTLANGVYLYVVTVKGYDGKVVNSEVRKLVILR
jgi:parallel beta-helix repeat protein